MTKVGIVYWTSSGNTQKMAEAVKEGAESKGAEVTLIEANNFSASDVANYDALGFGCPAMGAEQLEEGTFEPMFTSIEGLLSGKNVALFGSYGWGDGTWMRDWEERTRNTGANLVSDGVIANNEPDSGALAECKALGEKLA